MTFARRGIARFVMVRVLLGVATLVAVSIVVFASTQVLPGDPARAKLGRNAPPAAVAAIDKQLGLDRPAVVQYGDWAGGLLHGDLDPARDPDRRALGTLARRPVRRGDVLPAACALVRARVRRRAAADRAL